MAEPEDVDAYIAAQDEEARPTLRELRELVTATVPEAEEKIKYNVPFYEFHGVHVGFAAFKNHATFGIGADVLHSEEREMLEENGYGTGKETIQIEYGQEVPTTAIKQLLKAKVNKANQEE